MSRTKIKEILTCPITQENLKFPVLDVIGQTYEKDRIELWFSSHDTDPATNQILSSDQKVLISNLFAERLSIKLMKNTDFHLRDFTCPLSQKLLIDPVTTFEGHTYERSNLEAYFAEHGDIDPISKKPIQLIGDTKFVANLCAKQCTEIYKEKLKKKQEAKQIIQQALAQKDFETLKKVDKERFIKFFYDQSPAERITTVNLLISHLQPELLGYLYDRPKLHTEKDDDLFFSAFDLMWAMSTDIIYPICDPLLKYEYEAEDRFGGYHSLPKALRILSGPLKQQRERQAAFRRDLQANIETASNYTHEEIVFYLNAKDDNNDTLLHLAVQHSNLSLIEWLLSKGADVNQKNQQDQTPCDYAIANNNLDVIQLFIRRGIVVDQSVNEGSNNQANRLMLKVKTFLEEGSIEYERALSFKILKFFQKYTPKLIEFLASFIPEIDKPIKESQLLGELTQAYLQNKPVVKQKMVENRQEKTEIHRKYYPPLLINLQPVESADTKPQASGSADFRPTLNL